MKRKLSAVLTLALLTILNPQLSTAFAQGSLTPPGAPAPTMKSLDQIEPHIPISSLPIGLVKSGYYYVTTNLTSTTSGDGIYVGASDVTLDLNGYTLTGISPAGYGVDIYGTNVVVRNGTLRGWAQGAVYAYYGRHCRYENLRIFNCPGFAGLYGGPYCVVDNCLVADGGNVGIYALDGCRIVNCNAISNLSNGMIGGNGALVEKCIARGNAGGSISIRTDGVLKDCVADYNYGSFAAGNAGLVDSCTSVSNIGSGFQLSAQCRIVNSVAYSNSVFGIYLGAGCTAEGCVAAFNQNGFNVGDASTVSSCTTRSNSGTGFYLGTGSRALNCLALGNGSAGLVCNSSNAVVDGCQFISNVTGYTEFTGGNLVVRNAARRNSVNYSFQTNSISGPIISYGSGANLSGVITNSNPWANFSF